MNNQPDDEAAASRWVTLAEAAKATKSSPEALRQRVRRDHERAKRNMGEPQIQTQYDNKGQLLLRLADLALPPGRTPEHRGVRKGVRTPERTEEYSSTVKVLEAAVAALREAQQHLAAELKQQQERADRELEGRARAEGRAVELEQRALVAEERASRAEATATITQAEIEGWMAGGPIARAWRAFVFRRR